MNSGYFYCPYIPLTQTPIVLQERDFAPRDIMPRAYELSEEARHYVDIALGGLEYTTTETVTMVGNTKIWESPEPSLVDWINEGF